jgi:hypothetical protein
MTTQIKNVFGAALLKPRRQFFMGYTSLFHSWLLKHFNPKEIFWCWNHFFISLLLALAYDVADIFFVMITI